MKHLKATKVLLIIRSLCPSQPSHDTQPLNDLAQITMQESRQTLSLGRNSLENIMKHRSPTNLSKNLRVHKSKWRQINGNCFWMIFSLPSLEGCPQVSPSNLKIKSVLSLSLMNGPHVESTIPVQSENQPSVISLS